MSRSMLLTVLAVGVCNHACGGEPTVMAGMDNKLSAARVLAIRSEPVAPAPGESASLVANVYVPVEDPTFTSEESAPYRWSWCPAPWAADDEAACPTSEAELAARVGPTELPIPPFDLGTASTASFTHVFDDAALRSLCTHAQDRCEAGFPIQFKLRLSTQSGSSVGVHTLHLPFSTDPPPAANPELEPLTAVIGGVTRPLQDASVPRGRKTMINAALSEAGSNLASTAGELELDWFIDSGRTDVGRTSLDATAAAGSGVQNGWTPGPVTEHAGDVARVIVIVRDGHDGVSWTFAAARLVDTP